MDQFSHFTSFEGSIHVENEQENQLYRIHSLMYLGISIQSFYVMVYYIIYLPFVHIGYAMFSIWFIYLLVDHVR